MSDTAAWSATIAWAAAFSGCLATAGRHPIAAVVAFVLAATCGALCVTLIRKDRP